MNRRQFVSRVSVGTAAAWAASVASSAGAAPSGRLNVRFVGMMGFIEYDQIPWLSGFKKLRAAMYRGAARR